MHVVATAGHVDHGKSTLVRALTGIEPDRWEEERRRGLTIDLGYAWTTLGDGAEVAARLAGRRGVGGVAGADVAARARDARLAHRGQWSSASERWAGAVRFGRGRHLKNAGAASTCLRSGMDGVTLPPSRSSL